MVRRKLYRYVGSNARSWIYYFCFWVHFVLLVRDSYFGRRQVFSRGPIWSERTICERFFENISDAITIKKILNDYCDKNRSISEKETVENQVNGPKVEMSYIGDRKGGFLCRAVFKTSVFSANCREMGPKKNKRKACVLNRCGCARSCRMQEALARDGNWEIDNCWFVTTSNGVIYSGSSYIQKRMRQQCKQKQIAAQNM